MPHLLRGEIECAVAGFGIAEIDFGLDFIWLQVPHDAFRTAHSNLGFRNGFGTDLQVLRNVLKNDRRAQRDFGGLLVRGSIRTRDRPPVKAKAPSG